MRFIKNNYKIILIILGIIFLFYWIQIRPTNIKSACYDEATKIAINEMRIEKSEPYLYDRKNWKNYNVTKPIGRVSTSEMLTDDIFDYLLQPTFKENLKNETEPVYIQENLDRISKENEFYDEDYEKYYKRCLEKNGF